MPALLLAIGDFFARHGEPVIAGFFGGIAGSLIVTFITSRYTITKK